MEVGTQRTREELIGDFTELGERFAALDRNYTREQLLWRPEAAKAWCMAECVEHVALANAAYLAKIQPAISRAHAVAPMSNPLRIGGWLSGLLLKSISPQAERKLSAPKKIRPLAVEPSDAFKKLAASHFTIISILETKAQPDLNRVRFRNPFIPLIRFTVASGILIMAAHGRRHLLQAERIREMLEFPRSAA